MHKNFIWVTFQKEGIHKYPAALDDDRDIEFILFKRELESLYNQEGVMSLDYKSCEMIARDLAKYIQTKYPNRALSISVAEDNENGCRLTWD